jgi:methyl-accepting chemotaxis protein
VEDSADKNKRTMFLSIRVKLLVGFTLIFTLVFALAYYWFYTYATQVAKNQIRDDLVNTLNATADGLDGDTLVALAQTGKPNAAGFSDDPRYVQELDYLDYIHKIEPRAWPYTYVKGTGPLEVIFVADLWARYDPARAGKFLEPYTTEGPMYDGLTALNYDMTPYTDQWGSWVSAWMPVKDSKGNDVGGIGIDFRADYVFQVQKGIRDSVVGAFAVTYLALFVLVYLVSRAIASPIGTLTEIAERIGEGDYEQDLSHLTATRFPDEIAKLASVFEIMVGKVYQREQSLRREVEELRIMIDESKKKEQVQEIVDSEFFVDLKERAREMRNRSHKRPEEPKDR